MTKNSKQVSSAQLREWAALKLEIEERLDRDTARRAFLKVLQDEELVPYEYQLEAFLGSQQLADGDVEVKPPESFLAEQSELAIEKLNEFCREFLELTTVERQERCDDLWSSFPNSAPVRMRLGRLTPLLDFEVSQIRNEPELVQQLAEYLVDFAGRTPFQQGLLRQKLRARAAEDQTAWSRAAKRLQRRLPAVADVDQPLVRQLQTMALDPARDLPRPKVPLQSPKENSAENNSTWLIVLFIVGVGGAMGFLRLANEPDRSLDSLPQTAPNRPGVSNRDSETELQRLLNQANQAATKKWRDELNPEKARSEKKRPPKQLGPPRPRNPNAVGR